VRAWEVEEGKWKEESSFCEQKEAKKLYPFGPRGHWPSRAGSLNNRAPYEKSFLLLFFKKEDSCFLPLALRSPRGRIVIAQAGVAPRLAGDQALR
jgi:hypothetical protein